PARRGARARPRPGARAARARAGDRPGERQPAPHQRPHRRAPGGRALSQSGPAPGAALLTGGGGRLGRELRLLLPHLVAPTRAELDVTDDASVARGFARLRPRLVVHCAAYTDVAGAEREREACWRVNVEGTRRLVAAARVAGARFLHVSTDYVFYGDRGGYREDDTPGPTRNYYALTKLVAEEAARGYDRALVVRTSFRP